jgi:hypothetical protein
MLATNPIALAIALLCVGCGSQEEEWPLPNRDLASTRAAVESGIDRQKIRTLHVAWRFLCASADASQAS